MDEVYAPIQPQDQGPTLGGLMAREGGLLAWERSSRVHRTMKNGAIQGNSFRQTFLGWKQTADEMRRFSDPSHGFANWRSITPGGGKMLGSVWAPSTWATSMDIVDGTMKPNVAIQRMAFGTKDPYGTNATVSRAASKWHRAPAAADGSRFPATKLGWVETAWDDKISKDAAMRTVNQFLKGGGGASTAKNPALDMMWNLMFEAKGGNPVPMAGNRPGPWAKDVLRGYGKYETKALDAISSRLTKGYGMRAAGAEGIAGLTKFGSIARGTFAVGGAAITAYNWGTIGYYAGKGIYKAHEAYFVKAPMAAYKNVARQLGRPAFSSGDSSLLSGIPASNRMRAVQAIQGSRLNARSAFGGEASLLAGHFG